MGVFHIIHILLNILIQNRRENVPLLEDVIFLKSELCLLWQVIAGDALMGKRADWGVREKWEGNYLASSKENPECAQFQSSLRNMRNKDAFREVSTDSFSSCSQNLQAKCIM